MLNYDDSAGNLNAKLKHYLRANKTHYVAVQGYNGGATALAMTVSAASS